MKKTNVRGEIKALEKGSVLTLPRKNKAYRLSVVRSTASSVKSDTGKRFTVSADDKTITITRVG
ncbi:MAG: hypothetical protein LBL18_00440 [Bacteroidales bacterium]|jgi:hypothetical protein|nr:hypothetical protein [Bacteroidales bacterium]